MNGLGVQDTALMLYVMLTLCSTMTRSLVCKQAAYVTSDIVKGRAVLAIQGEQLAGS